MANPEYNKYLLSDKWASIKLDLFTARGRKCEMSGYIKSLHVHHKTYENIFNEKPEDLLIVCQSCHQDIHFPKNKSKKISSSKSYQKKKKSKKRKITVKQSLHNKVNKKKSKGARRKKRGGLLKYLKFTSSG